jgi:hypothetical protein
MNGTQQTQKVAIVCSPTAEKKHKEEIERMMKGRINKSDISFFTTDAGLNDIPGKILTLQPTYIIGVDAPQGTMSYIHSKTFDALNKQKPGYIFVTKKLNAKATPLPNEFAVVEKVGSILDCLK